MPLRQNGSQTMTTSYNDSTNSAAILRPEGVGNLIIEPLTKESPAFQVSTVVTTSSTE